MAIWFQGHLNRLLHTAEVSEVQPAAGSGCRLTLHLALPLSLTLERGVEVSRS